MGDRLHGMNVCSRCKKAFYLDSSGARIRCKELSKNSEYYILCANCLKEFKKFIRKEI